MGPLAVALRPLVDFGLLALLALEVDVRLALVLTLVLVQKLPPKVKSDERQQDEVKERAQRDREHSQMEGRIAAQMERSNSLMEAMKTLMESVVASNEVLHNDLAHSQTRSQGMAQKVDHICDRVDLLYDKETRSKNEH
mgnify:CR=1 FL=1